MFVQFFCASRDAGGQQAACANPNRLIKPWRDPSGALQRGCPVLETNNPVAGGAKRFRERSQSSAPAPHYIPGRSWLDVCWSLGSTGMKESQ